MKTDPEQYTDADDRLGAHRPDGDNETAEALGTLNPVDLKPADDMPMSMCTSLGAVQRGFSRVADPDVLDAGIDSGEQQYGGRLDQGGFLGRPGGFAR